MVNTTETGRDLTLLSVTQRFSTEEAAIQYFEAIRWPSGPYCPHCGNADEKRIYKLTANEKRGIRLGLYKCAECRDTFTVRVGTVMEDSHVPLHKWLIGFYMMCASKTQVSALQLQRQLVTLSLSDARYFRMSIGERVLKKDLFRAEPGKIPLYSANFESGREHGWVKQSNIKDFSHPSVLWSIDNTNFNVATRNIDEVFAATDHCGRLEILDPHLDAEYCQAAIVYGYGRTYGFDRVTRPSITRMRRVTLRVPVKPDGSFDLEAQRNLAREFVAIQDAVRIASDSLETIKELKPRADIPKDAEDLGPQPGKIESQSRYRRQLSKQDRRDAEIATTRLKKIAANPKHLVSGAALEAKLEEILS